MSSNPQGEALQSSSAAMLKALTSSYWQTLFRQRQQETDVPTSGPSYIWVEGPGREGAEGGGGRHLS